MLKNKTVGFSDGWDERIGFYALSVHCHQPASVVFNRFIHISVILDACGAHKDPKIQFEY